MTVVATVPSNSYQVGDRSFGPANIALGVTKIQATFTREAWPLTNQDAVLQCGIECSLDGGVTWPVGAYNYDPSTNSGGWVGGSRINKSGVTVLSEMIARSDLPEPTNPNRKVRAITRVLSDLQTAVTVETF